MRSKMEKIANQHIEMKNAIKEVAGGANRQNYQLSKSKTDIMVNSIYNRCKKQWNTIFTKNNPLQNITYQNAENLFVEHFLNEFLKDSYQIAYEKIIWADIKFDT